MLNFDNCIIRIEVKYLSGLSSDDDVDIDFDYEDTPKIYLSKFL